MDFNLITSNENCYSYLVNETPISLVYYAHFLNLAASLFLGVFVFLRDRRKLINKIFFSFTLIFSIWLILDFYQWVGIDSRLIMFDWAIVNIFDVLFFTLILYFVYLFIDKKDISFLKKAILGLVSFPIVFLASTRFYLKEFNDSLCVPIENRPYLNYIFIAELIIAVWVIALSINRYKKSDNEFRKQLSFLITGVLFFILFFFVAGYISEYLYTNLGYEWGYEVELYSLFGVSVFLGTLAYLIVRYKAFNIKLLGAQALVFAQAILIGSAFLFVQNTTNTVLVAVTFVLTCLAGYVLIKSVKLEVERKEQLQWMSDELAKKNEQLKKLDNAKTEFISIASHQLRTPLTAVKGFIAMLLDGTYGQVDQEKTEVLNKVYQSNERLINLVEDLLNISRIESGRMEYKFDQWDMAKMGQEIIDTFMLKAKGQGLYLEYKNPEGLPLVITDGAKLREVVSNLVDNAIKYTPKGGVTLRITQEGEGHIRFTVSDTGIGVPQEELPYLFSKFSRGKDIGRLNAGGTGLGLYVGRSMIEALGGKIWAESDGANKGSRFIVEIPLEQKEMVYGKGLGMGVVK